jgi:hypothetical protein
MRKDMSDESFRTIIVAVERILDHFGNEPADAAHVEYQEGDFTFFATVKKYG